MAEGPYRDALAAVRERVEELEAEVLRREQLLNAVDLALVPRSAAARVDELRARVTGEPEPTLAAWTEREGALGELVAALERAHALAPELEIAAEPPLPEKSTDPRPFLFEEARHDLLKVIVEAELSEHALQIRRERWSDESYIWHFELQQVALTLYGCIVVVPFTEALNMELTLYGAMPPELGPLTVVPSEWWYRVPQTAEDPEFARRFHVRGDARLADALLTDALREHFVVLEPRRPHLTVADAVARLDWQLTDVANDPPPYRVIDAAWALVALRRALE